MSKPVHPGIKLVVPAPPPVIFTPSHDGMLDKIKDLEAERRDLFKTIQALENDQVYAENNHKGLHEDYKKLQEKNSKWNDDYNKLEEKQAELVKERDGFKFAFEVAERTSKHLGIAVSTRQEKIEEQTSRIESLEKQVKGLIKQLEEETKTRINTETAGCPECIELAANCDNYQGRLESKKEKNKKLKEEVEQMQGVIDTLNLALARSPSKLTAEDRTLKRRAEEIVRRDEERKRLCTEKDKREQEYIDWKRRKVVENHGDSCRCDQCLILSTFEEPQAPHV